ncbi:MAG: diphthine--ammonia ligase [Dehalococcoidia bacterium]|nr:diphthine--ammonia ligase [Dehalococcoidia bacterium]
MIKVATFWSGGKDSCLACYKAMQQGHDVAFLINLLQEDGKRTLSHLLDRRLIDMQSFLTGIPLMQRNVTRENQEAEYASVIEEARREGVRGCVFGDIAQRAHRDWLESVCHIAGVEAIFPLWEADRQEIIREFIAAGFEAVVVAVKGRIMGQDWLGRNLNEQFVSDVVELQKTVNLDLCGEWDEYHTLVTAGPLFKQRIKVTLAQPVLRDEYWYADILGYEIV